MERCPLLTTLTAASKLHFRGAKRRRTPSTAVRSGLRCRCCYCCCSCRCSNLLLSLILLLLVVLLPAGSRVEAAAARGEDTLNVKSKVFRNPRATFYDFLGVSPRTSQDDIKRVFRKLAVKMHPDKLGPFESEEEEGEANAIFVKVPVSVMLGMCMWERFNFRILRLQAQAVRRIGNVVVAMLCCVSLISLAVCTHDTRTWRCTLVITTGR